MTSLRMELDTTREKFDEELMKYKGEIAELQHRLDKVAVLQQRLDNFKRLADEEKMVAAAALKEKEQQLFSAEEKVIDLAKMVESMRSELDQMQSEREELIASYERQVDEFQREYATLDELRRKVTDRDQTIEGLLKTAAAQDEKLATSEAEKAKFMERLKNHEIITKDEEVKQLKAALEQRRRNEVALEDEVQKLLEQIKSNKKSNQSVADLQIKLDEVLSTVAKLEREKAVLEDALRESALRIESVQELESKLQEKEEMMARLEKTLSDREEQIKSLQTEVDEGKKKASLDFQKMQEESEIFACQIIEQEEELEQLRKKLEDKERRNRALEMEFQELSGRVNDSAEVANLKLQLEDMEASNSSLRDEAEQLRSELNDVEEMGITELESRIDELQISLASLTRENSVLRDQNAQLMEAKLQQDVAAVVSGTKDPEKQALKETIAEQEAAISDFAAKLKDKEFQILELEQELHAVRSSARDDEPEKSGNEDLQREVAELMGKNQILEKQAKQAAELKKKLEESENGRLLYEKNSFELFEKRLATVKLNKDAALDSLRKEVASLKAGKKEMEIDLMNQITALESKRNGSRSEIEMKVKTKDETISRLEQQVLSQEKLVNNMRLEMEQLRGSMTKASISRRDEVEEMHQELMDSSAKLKQQERDIAALKMKLEEGILQHADELFKLRSQLATREVESATAKGAREIREKMEIEELNEAIQQLRRRNTSLIEENSKLNAKLETMEADTGANGKTDKWRTSALKEQVKALMLRVQELEGKTKESRSNDPQWMIDSPTR